MSRLRQITEQTVIPISLVIVLFGGVAWLTNLAAAQKVQGEKIEELRSDQGEILKMREDIAVIRTKVESMEFRMNRRGR